MNNMVLKCHIPQFNNTRTITCPPHTNRPMTIHTEAPFPEMLANHPMIATTANAVLNGDTVELVLISLIFRSWLLWSLLRITLYLWITSAPLRISSFNLWINQPLQSTSHSLHATSDPLQSTSLWIRLNLRIIISFLWISHSLQSPSLWIRIIQTNWIMR